MRLGAVVAVVLLALSLPLVGGSAWAQEAPATLVEESLTGAAKAHYAAGISLFNDGDFGRALVELKAAHEASKESRLFWNLAACERGLRHYAEATRYLERYKEEVSPSAQFSDKDRADADEVIAALRPHVAFVSVKANVDGAIAYVDDQIIGKTPVERYLVDLGSHRLVVKSAGYTDYSAPIHVNTAEAMTLDVRLEAQPHQGKLSVTAKAGDAISIDGKAVGIASYEATLPSGMHVVRVTAQGKKPFEQRIVIEDNQLRTFDVALEKDSIVQRVPLWAVIGIGAAAATGLVVLGYFALRSDEEAPKPINGTMQPGLVQLPSWRFP